MTSAFQRERLDFLLDRLANDEPLQPGLDQKNEEPLPLGLDQKNDWLSGKRRLSSKRWLSSKRPSLGKPSSRALIRSLIAFSIGVAATLAWQSYGTRSPDLRQQAMSLDLAAVRQSVDQLAAKHQQMADDIAKLQAAQQAILRKVSTLPPPSPRQPRNAQN
jgi:hypothetical protein